ncbi:di-trans,poly-cis-decaprenylcistransferase [Candidatus Saccharibacteria bacterium]|nr:di-trans,poly-cis-decaprenylcistransferase [Candidatus Saccharibacteria bacterium]
MTADNIPKHVGLIIDGNRRWAKKHGLPTYEGHLAGYETLKNLILTLVNEGVEYVSVYGFSTENWKRSQDEVKNLMGLVLRVLTSDMAVLTENDIKLKVLGSREGLNDRIIKAIDNAEELTKDNKTGTFALCFNYGGQLEIVDAIKKIIQSGVPADEVNVDMVSQNLYAPEIPPVDLVIRTSGEKRLSNFMLWRVEYSEFTFVDKLWPDMTSDDISEIIQEYTKRHRRIGK